MVSKTGGDLKGIEQEDEQLGYVWFWLQISSTVIKTGERVLCMCNTRSWRKNFEIEHSICQTLGNVQETLQ